jgi:hypothetical protein
MTQQAIITTTQNWLSTFIIPYNICPFAQRVFEQNSIRYQVIYNLNLEESLHTLIQECQYLDQAPETETTLLIFAHIFQKFDDFLDLIAIAEQLLDEQGYAGVYQLASFHPDYCFAESAENDPANYTNRSPYPMLHIIRESSISLALQHYRNSELIPERNIDLTRTLGRDKLQTLLDATFKSIYL